VAPVRGRVTRLETRESPDRAAASEVQLSVVVPVFNEAEVLAETHRRLTTTLARLGEPYEILYVDDGSTDGSPQVLAAIADGDPAVGVLSLSRNFGHQPAITAGLEHARGQAIVVIDADLQDPPELIPDLVAEWRRGYAVVHARRTARRGESVVKRLSAAAFYRLLGRLSDAPVAVDSGDFRLIDARVRNVLAAMPERRRYVRGMVSWAGFRQTSVPFVREARAAGRSKYGLGRMLALAADGITASTERPLSWIGYLGGVLLGAAGAAAPALAVAAAAGARLSPWLWAAVAAALLEGTVLCALGVMAAYVARIHAEVRGRPGYVLAELRPPAWRQTASP
jgi:hypothetical protein